MWKTTLRLAAARWRWRGGRQRSAAAAATRLRRRLSAPAAPAHIATAAAAAAARREIAELQRSMAVNARLKGDLQARLEDNEAQGARIREELDALCTSDEKRELLGLEYRVCLLELEKVE